MIPPYPYRSLKAQMRDEQRLRDNAPKISVTYRGRERGETPYQADAWLPNGRDYHALGATPQEALLELAIFWTRRERALGATPAQSAQNVREMSDDTTDTDRQRPA